MGNDATTSSNSWAQVVQVASILSAPFHFHLEEKTRAAAVQAQTYEAKVLLRRGRSHEMSYSNAWKCTGYVRYDELRMKSYE